MKPLTRRTVATVGALSLLSLGLTACGGSDASASDATVLRFAHVLAESEPAAQEIRIIAKEVEKRTDGRVQIKVFPAGQLGSDAEINDAIDDGTVDITVASPPFAKMPELSVELAPFLYDSGEQMQKSMRSQVAKELLWDTYTEKTGLVCLDQWYSGFNNFTSNKKFSSVKDLAGVKIRVPESEASIDMIKALGATAVPIGFPELYTALQTNVVDSQYNPLPRIFSSNFQEVQKYFIPVDISMNMLTVSISKTVFDKLSAQDQETLREVARESGDRVLKENQKTSEELRAKIDAGAMSVVEPDLESFRTAILEKFLPKYESVYGAGVYQKLQEAGN